MITLYIKTHRKTGLRYFGKTIEADPVAYKGSGTYWRRHLLKHGSDFDTEIYLQSEDIDYINREALRFSRAYNIVNSDLWANLIEENGLDGLPPGLSFTKEHRENLAKAHTGKVHSEEQCKKMSNAMKGMKRPYLLGVPLPQETCEKISKANKGKVRTLEMREKYSKAKGEKWLLTNPDGDEMIIFSLSKFCRDNFLTSSNMKKVAIGERKHHKGWKCKKLKENTHGVH